MAAGYHEIRVNFTRSPAVSFPVGTLAEKDGAIFFQYEQDWLNQGLELSPFTLPLQAGLIRHNDLGFGPIFGLFDDSLPDGWGLLLMDRFFRSQAIDPATVSILDRLLYLGSNTMGALTYQPARQQDNNDLHFDLLTIADEAARVFAGKSEDILPQLLKAGGSPGGARPKVLAGYNPDTSEIVSEEDILDPGFSHWLIKFPAHEDRQDAGPVEYAYALMAAAAGVEMTESRLFPCGSGVNYFGTKRFDRLPENRRIHCHTFGNLIHANFRIPGCDYEELLKATSLLTRDEREVRRAFCLMCFNVLAHNRDDHVKNFSFQLDEQTGNWSLAPAYDLTFSRGPGGEHTTTIMGEGRKPDQKHCLQLADRAGISQDTAKEIFSSVQESVCRWPEWREIAGVRRETGKAIGRFLNIS